ncbi:protein MOS2-like [Euphorbia lathyris]|uniref:protein MOS2-like n=1 Tax=Euphorbia lathyris TaxID=212925 RepID=UPI0033138B02
MKLSFSIPAKSAPKSSHKPKASSEFDVLGKNNGAEKQYVTEFDPSKTLASSNRTIIPPQENEWRPHKRMKNIELLPSLQSGSEGLRFEIATGADGGDDNTMGYGLNIREQSNADGDADGGAGVKGQQKHKGADNMLEKLRYDLQRLPEDRGLEEFNGVTVEGFAEALMAGYGWYEGRGIGKNAKGDVKVKEYHKRTDKEGLGFVASASNTSNKSVKDTDKPKEKKRDRGGHADGFSVGKEVRVIDGGRDIFGSKCKILERLDDDCVVVKLSETKQELKLRISDIADLGSKEEEKCLRKLKALQIETNQLKGRDNEKRISKSAEASRVSLRRDSNQSKDERMRWLRNHIRVRIISKDLKGGRFYLKKGEVVDVVGPYVCDISMDDTKELVQGVNQDLLETALPRRAGPVLVLYGKHKGAYGNLVKRDLDRETGVVQDLDTHELLNVKLEQVAEYVGDPSYIGY